MRRKHSKQQRYSVDESDDVDDEDEVAVVDEKLPSESDGGTLRVATRWYHHKRCAPQ